MNWIICSSFFFVSLTFKKSNNNQECIAKHGSSEVQRRIATRLPTRLNFAVSRSLQNCVSKHKPFITLQILLLLRSYTHTHTHTPIVLPQSQCNIELLENSHISEPTLELQSRAAPIVGGITAQAVQTQVEIPEECRTEKKLGCMFYQQISPHHLQLNFC